MSNISILHANPSTRLSMFYYKYKGKRKKVKSPEEKNEKYFQTMECIVFNELVQRIENLEKEVALLRGKNQSDWYDVEGVCKMYHLPIHNVKSRKWRLEHNFPVFQDSPCCRVAFKGSMVEKWIDEHLNSVKLI